MLGGGALPSKPQKPDGKRVPRPEPVASRAGRRATSRPPATRPNRTSRPPRQGRINVSSPEITVQQAPAGRETLAAIEEELAKVASTSFRAKLETIRYDERPKEPPSTTTFRGSSPEIITISEGPIGRVTMEAIEEELVQEALANALTPQPYRSARPARSKVFEISIFVVEGDEISVGATEEVRRAFVQQRLLHRVPALSMNEVVRISVSPTVEPNTVIVRVWSAVGPPG
jgi:hypothetical protein